MSINTDVDGVISDIICLILLSQTHKLFAHFIILKDDTVEGI